MELLQLKYFCDAAQSENFSQTAKKYCVPPSNISQSIKRLEKELSVKLFVRTANRVKLSKQGESFYEKIIQALGLIDSAEKEAKGKDFSGEIKIYATVNRRAVMKTIEEFTKVYKDINFVTVHSKPDNLEEYDIIISDEEFSQVVFAKQLLLTEKMLLAVSVNSQLAENENIKTQDIKNEIFISRDKGSSLYRHTEKICDKLGFVPRIAIQSDDPFYMRRCVELGLGIAFVPEFSWEGQFSDNIVLKDIGEIKRDTYLYTNLSRQKSRVVSEFSKMLKNICNK
ncbi:MAG: LysR family transcriptional regulator [Clostridia bacterium]|nr:LysR family transcriptional regulator [Clostridia bacterium]